MTPERWQKLDEIFQAAIDLQEAERPGFLAQACGGDEALRRDAESLMEHARGSSGVPTAIGEVSAQIAADLAERAVGRRIGPYLVSSVIGSGGMGVVYAAVRDDHEFSKQVAIKLVKRGMDTDFVLTRFRTERQILATLEHSQIARLIDGGATADGQPYLVMEYVDGLPITEHCERHQLSITDRLNLFRGVCEAVQYAHRNLVVHRDIKPGNILVTKEGLPKLLDFGVAKLLEPSAEAGTLTSLGGKVLTPDYASPEQVRGERVTTATDVYSLGAVLYELLTGARPHRLTEYTAAEIEQAVCRTEVERPSIAAGKLQKRIPRDLDEIVMMALRKEPERRYASVEQLSEDVRRHLEGRPVSARPDTLVYRTGKFVRRYKLAVAAAVVAVVSLATGAVATAWQARRAEQRFQQVRKLANVFLFDLHDRLRDLPGTIEVRRFAVRTGLDYLATLEREAGGDPELLRELALAYRRVGDLQGFPLESNLGDSAGAIESYQKALLILERQAARSGDAAVQLDLAEAFRRMAEVQMVRADAGGALSSYRKAQSLVEALLTREGKNKAALQLFGLLQTGVGRVLSLTHDIPGLAQEAARAVALHEKLLAAQPGDAELQGTLAVSYRLTGTALQRAGRHREALEYLLKNVALRERQAADQPSNVARQRDVMLAYSYVGDLLTDPMMSPPDPAGALDSYRKMLAIAQSLSKRDQADKRFRTDVAFSLLRVGTALALTPDHEEALRALRQALELAEGLLAADAGNFTLGINIAHLQERIAYVLTQDGDLAAALPHAGTAVRKVDELMEKDPARKPLLQALMAYRTYLPLAGRTGDRAAVQAVSAKLPPLADLAGKASEALVVARGPEVLEAAGEAYESLGDLPSSCEWYGKSLHRWNELRRAGFSGGLFESGPPKVEARLARCPSHP